MEKWQPLLAEREFELRASDDAQAYSAWVVTPTGIVFGLAGRGGDYPHWVFVGEEPPAGGIDDDARWLHITEADYPDW